MLILFKIFPQRSHYNATFGLASSLRLLGHEIVYSGLATERAYVEAQGFRYFTESHDLFPGSSRRGPAPVLGTVALLSELALLRKATEAKLNQLVGWKICAESVGALKPEFVLVDSPYTLYAASLVPSGTPFAIIESMMNLDWEANIPPMDCDFVPRDTLFSKLVCNVHWLRYYVKRGIMRRLWVRRDHNPRFLRRYLKANSISPNAISFNRYFHPGFPAVPEIFLSPRFLDFPRKPATWQLHAFSASPLDRQEASCDLKFERVLELLRLQRGQGRRLVYCSLGTAAWRYKGARAFLQKVIDASRGSEWNLLLAVGDVFSFDHFEDVPATVTILRAVPQLTVLQNADLMISHGGMNSVTECARFGVPMLVCPGTREIDQAGNAARVVYHQFGLKGRFSDNVRTVRAKVRTILGNPRFAARAQAIRGAFQDRCASPAEIAAVLNDAYAMALKWRQSHANAGVSA